MAYQFKEPNPNVQKVLLSYPVGVWELLQEIADFEHTTRSRIINTFIKGATYEKLQHDKKYRYKAYQALSQQKTAKKAKSTMQKARDCTQCLPYFRDE